MTLLSFYVQNFKEDYPTLIIKNSRRLLPSDTESQLLVKDIGKLVVSGTKREENNVSIFYKDFKFYIELATHELDISNRPAIFGV
jgi:hypothetical protein